VLVWCEANVSAHFSACPSRRCLHNCPLFLGIPGAPGSQPAPGQGGLVRQRYFPWGRSEGYRALAKTRFSRLDVEGHQRCRGRPEKVGSLLLVDRPYLLLSGFSVAHLDPRMERRGNGHLVSKRGRGRVSQTLKNKTRARMLCCGPFRLPCNLGQGVGSRLACPQCLLVSMPLAAPTAEGGGRGPCAESSPPLGPPPPLLSPLR